MIRFPPEEERTIWTAHQRKGGWYIVKGRIQCIYLSEWGSRYQYTTNGKDYHTVRERYDFQPLCKTREEVVAWLLERGYSPTDWTDFFSQNYNFDYAFCPLNLTVPERGQLLDGTHVWSIRFDPKFSVNGITYPWEFYFMSPNGDKVCQRNVILDGRHSYRFKPEPYSTLKITEEYGGFWHSRNTVTTDGRAVRDLHRVWFRGGLILPMVGRRSPADPTQFTQIWTGKLRSRAEPVPCGRRGLHAKHDTQYWNLDGEMLFGDERDDINTENLIVSPSVVYGTD